MYKTLLITIFLLGVSCDSQQQRMEEEPVGEGRDASTGSKGGGVSPPARSLP